MEFKDLVSKVVTDGDNPICTQEELQEIVDEFNGREQTIANLTEQLEQRNKEYDNLKSKIVEQMFNNSNKVVKEEPKKEEQPKTFKDLINPTYQYRK